MRKRGLSVKAAAEGASSLDRRAFLKGSAASAALVAPATVLAQSPEAEPAQRSVPDQIGKKGATISNGGLSRARLGRMHDVMAGHVEQGGMPGLVTLVSRHGEVFVDAIGKQAVSGNEPMRRDTIFRIASMTKPIIAVATLILVEECKVQLDEPVDRLLPELADRKVLKRLDGPLDDTVPAKRPITVRDLLTFRSGFGIVMAPPGTYPIQIAVDELDLGQGPPRPSKAPAPDEWIRRLGTLPLLHQPGEKWMYHTGSDILGVVIARAAGQALETFLSERIFKPLEMKDTGFSVPASIIDRLATSYRPSPETRGLEIYDEAKGGEWSRPPAFPAGGSGLVSTVDDYLAFGQMMLNNGKLGNERILSRPSVETMTTDQLTPAQKAASGLVEGYFDNHGWGFGVSVVTRRENIDGSVGKYGWDGGLGTSWYSDPREDMVTILMTQRAWTSPNPPEVCRDFWTLAYQAIDD
jgi:CubicO group peptidase (beta-lactamase class C family)